MVIPSETKQNLLIIQTESRIESVNKANRIKKSPPNYQERRTTVAKRKCREGAESRLERY